MEISPGRTRLPEELNMGLLADRRNPDPLWASALEVCDRAFASIREGTVPEEILYPDVRVPLSLAFSRVLFNGGKNIFPLYALPHRDGNRLEIQVRLSGGGMVSYGYIYLVRLDGVWFIDQWMLDLSGYPDEEIAAESES
ncbi:MAG: hypothetical protein KAH21_08830 [Spirochaetaceae bacterium]|nr:hypothetical protein [Spirochaetaceae bacterium]